MSRYIEIWCCGVLIQYWVSDRGYCYKRFSNGKVKRIRKSEYQLAHETHYNLNFKEREEQPNEN